MSTYREELCNKDEKGIPVFSPLCKPGRTVDTNLTYQVSNQDLQKLYKERLLAEQNDNLCYIPPVHYPSKHAVRSFDDSNSANNWFNDPTYAQHVARRQYVPGKGIQENHDKDSASLQLYHVAKTMERVAGSMMQSL